jgi:hypothetical protein
MINETLASELLAIITVAFLCGFWLLPGGVLALRRRAHGELQVDLRPGYTPDTLYRLLQLYGSDGIRSFRRMLFADMIFPLVYASLLLLLADLAVQAHPTLPRVASVLRVAAIAAAAVDYLENLFLLQVVHHLPRHHRVAARAAGLSTSLKTISLVTAVIALLMTLLSPGVH